MRKASSEGRLPVFHAKDFDIRFWKFSLACGIVETRLIAAVRVNVTRLYVHQVTIASRRGTPSRWDNFRFGGNSSIIK
jgi:hypothetical protein